MKPWLRYTIGGTFLAALSAGTVLLAREVRDERHIVACNEVSVRIMDSYRFVSEDDVKSYIVQDCGPCVGQRLDSLRLSAIENALDSRSAILRSEAWTTADGVLNVSITQRCPIVRFEGAGGGFFVDDTGFIFPLLEGFDLPIPVVEGALPLSATGGFKGEAATPGERLWIGRMLALVHYMQDHKWYDRIDKVKVSEKGDLELSFRDAPERVVFGVATDIAAKFARMDDYFNHIAPLNADTPYASVDVRFSGQIVCKK